MSALSNTQDQCRSLSLSPSLSLCRQHVTARNKRNRSPYAVCVAAYQTHKAHKLRIHGWSIWDREYRNMSTMSEQQITVSRWLALIRSSAQSLSLSHSLSLSLSLPQATSTVASRMPSVLQHIKTHKLGSHGWNIGDLNIATCQPFPNIKSRSQGAWH